MNSQLALIRPELERLAQKLRNNTIKVIDDEKLVYKGLLRTSIQTRLILNDKDAKIELYVNDPGQNRLSYAKYIHEGIKPHMPPLEPIKKWVKTKGLHQNKFKKAWEKTKNNNLGLPRKNKVKKASLEDQHISSIAWAIAINMKKKGKKPVPFLNLAVKMTLDNL
ncbi:MAG: hypothetical protein RBS16_01950 [Candidatus Cloacimonadales bacterium]|jgi:hypothetical protein|nr:hypothetical protein [Candidatus Cloacimonadota bacterium]MDX9976776.1 hypothetical protein [Candidatus Cloacimonadales bacterium]